ncbi:hypothetical protein [Nocardioides nitrophenolicus]|uniref:hypothetical protein n=1 Tax=Nocardioides nitrophenolicus TaxID=60489 RepID=UPI001957CC51|nr:hypothetical protein [Nocardioides nitrophenolicus]MBM7519474.1 hypothetical protein [Nocardioides nitrophenolicus]
MTPQRLIVLVRVLAVLVLASFPVVVALPRSGDRVTVAATAVVAMLLAGSLGLAVRGGAARVPAAVVTAAGGLAVAGAEAYLLNLPSDGADIPLAGVGILFLGLLALLVGVLTVARPRVR